MADLNNLDVIQSGEAIHIEEIESGSLELMEVGVGHSIEWYEGPYIVTPSSEEQTIAISEKLSLRDITVQPIPQNYGRIEWNGSTLRVS